MELTLVIRPVWGTTMVYLIQDLVVVQIQSAILQGSSHP